jgi:hypothetical protein
MSETYRFEVGEVIILFPPDYPTTKPFILASKISGGRKGNAIEILFPWLFSYSGISQLTDVCGDAIINFMEHRQSKSVLSPPEIGTKQNSLNQENCRINVNV